MLNPRLPIPRVRDPVPTQIQSHPCVSAQNFVAPFLEPKGMLGNSTFCAGRTGGRLKLHGRIASTAQAAGAGKPPRTGYDQPAPEAPGRHVRGRLNWQPRPGAIVAHAHACAEASDATVTKPSTPDPLEKPLPRGLTPLQVKPSSRFCRQSLAHAHTRADVGTGCSG